eukprot:jgi/Mesen1/1462/ME000132S00403
MAPVKVYGAYYSTCTMRVLTTLYEKEAEYELVPIDLTKGEHKQPEFLARQPFGQIPVLDDGEIEIFESRAIFRHLALKFKEQGNELFGPTPNDRSKIDSYIEAEQANFNPPISAIVYEKVWAPMYGRTTDEARVAENQEKLGKVLDVYEKILASRPYLAGEEFTLADLSHMPYSHYTINVAKAGQEFESRPNVKAWIDRLFARPSWAKILELQPKH